jgi:hypothetical protein
MITFLSAARVKNLMACGSGRKTRQHLKSLIKVQQ